MQGDASLFGSLLESWPLDGQTCMTDPLKPKPPFFEAWQGTEASKAHVRPPVVLVLGGDGEDGDCWDEKHVGEVDEFSDSGSSAGAPADADASAAAAAAAAGVAHGGVTADPSPGAVVPRTKRQRVRSEQARGRRDQERFAPVLTAMREHMALLISAMHTEADADREILRQLIYRFPPVAQPVPSPAPPDP